MPSSGWYARSATAATAPSWVNVGGIRMSTMATSGACAATASASPAASASGRADLDAGLGEQPGQAFAQQRGVVGDHDTHGSSASTTVPCGWFSVTRRRPPSADDPVRQPLQPSAPRVGVADAVVRDDDAQRRLLDS